MSVSCHQCGGEILPHESRIPHEGKVFCSPFCKEEYDKEDVPEHHPELSLVYQGQQLELTLK